MKRILLAALVLFSSCVFSQSQPPAPTPAKPSQPPQQQPASGTQQTSADQGVTIKTPVEVKLLNTGKTSEETKQEAYDRKEKSSSDWWLVILTGILAFLALLQLAAFSYQGWQLKRTVDSAERSVMPFLLPQISKFDLYPPSVSNASDTHRPSVRFIFNNYGKTPAAIRKVFAELILISRDKLPPIPPAIKNAIPIHSDAVVPADKPMVGRPLKCAFGKNIGATEIKELMAGVNEPNWKRFFLVGCVIYDDFFDMRTEKSFCLKLRQNGFQPISGGERYNTVKRYPAPKVDSLPAIEEVD